MAGTDPRFPSQKFKDAIHFAMNMGFPDNTNEQVIWRWKVERTFDKADSGGLPYEWTNAHVVDDTVVDDLTVACAVKFQPGNATRVGGTALGVMDVTHGVITLMDEDRTLLLDHGNDVFPDQVIIADTRYEVQFTAPPYAIFDVTFYDVFIDAIDEV